MSIVMIIGAVIVGLITGTVTSLIGASGVSVVVPALTLFFGISSHIAIGSSLLVDVITSIIVSISYFKHHNVRLAASLWIAVGSIAGSQLGSHWAGLIPDGSLDIVFAIVLLISGISTLRRGGKVFDSSKGLHFDSAVLQDLSLLVLGFLIGIISGLVGAGGGVMVLLTIIFILHYPMHEAVGTSTFIMCITALSSLVGYARQGNVDWKIGLIIAAGAVVAGAIGSKFANEINEIKLSKIVSWIFIVLSIMMVAVHLV
jgi:uncharacterized membrane protein YfcA